MLSRPKGMPGLGDIVSEDFASSDEAERCMRYIGNDLINLTLWYRYVFEYRKHKYY